MRWKCLAVLAALLVLAGCSGAAPGSRQTVPGMFVRVGGPPPGAPFPLPGSITARAANGATFTATAGQNGRFTLSLPPGRYQVSGRSPLIESGQMACLPATDVRVIRGQSPHAVTVVCSIS